MSTPLLSILIPTKNREEYALKVICQILEINDARLQIIIQDNSDSNKLEYLLSDCLKDSRIKYYYHKELLSFVENFSVGISRCDGEYITIIGDDDGINPVILDIVEWAHQNETEAITPALPVIYYWPQSGVHAEDGNGKLTISDFSCEAKFCDPRKEVIKLLKNGCQHYLSFNLAKLYHGVIKKSVLDKVKAKTGNYIGGLSPDIYVSVATSLLIKQVLIIDYPLTISGICNKSGSADSATGRHTGELRQAPHFRGHTNYEWSDKVPQFYSVETIWGDSALAAIKDLKLFELIKYFSIDVISANCKKLYPEFTSFIIDNLCRNYKIAKAGIAIRFHLIHGFVKGPFKTHLKAVRNQIFNKKYQKTFDNTSDIRMATEIVQKHIDNENKKIFINLQLITKEKTKNE